MSKPILRIGKIKTMGTTTPQSVGAHLARSRPTPNADPKRTPLNRWLVPGSAPNQPLDEMITDGLKRYGIDRTKLRKDATIANDILLTVSPEWFRPDAPEAAGTWDENRLKAFTAEAEKFLKKQFGPRLVCAVLHLDEATPHVQAIVLPILGKQGEYRLSSKDTFSPKTLPKYQQAWQDQLTPHGVGPRTKGSRARHTTLREYYSALEATRSTEDKRHKFSLSDPPVKGRLETAAAYEDRVQQWKKDETKRMQQELRPLAIEASRGRLYDAERRSGVAVRTTLAEQAESLSRAYEQIGSDKAVIDRLRGTPINQVAAMLGYTDPIKKGENAIDLVKRVGELDYKAAVGWLAQRFGPEAAAAAVADEAKPKIADVAKTKTVLTKPERVKLDLVGKQLDALAAPAYRITATRMKGDKDFAQNLGTDLLGKDELTRKEVLSIVPRLASYNASGANILLTPIEGADVHHVLIDDVKPDGLNELRARGYSPSIIMETSPNNHQVVIKVGGPKEAVNSWFKDVNRDLGDAKIVGLKHPMRLAGFENRKPKHQGEDGRFPFVRLLHHVNSLCARSAAVIQAYIDQLDLPTKPNSSTRSSGPKSS